MTEPDVEASRPGWWRENDRYKAALDLPPYEPPRFADGAYVHEVVEPLEERYGCGIQFIGVHVRFGDDWEIRIGGETAFPIGRYRDENGNTVYDVTADAFRDRVEEAVA